MLTAQIEQKKTFILIMSCAKFYIYLYFRLIIFIPYPPENDQSSGAYNSSNIESSICFCLTYLKLDDKINLIHEHFNLVSLPQTSALI